MLYIQVRVKTGLVVGLVGVGDPGGTTRIEATTCLAEALGAVQVLGSEKGIWVSERHPEAMPMIIVSTLWTLHSDLKIS